MGSLYFVLVFLFILGILVFFHELGHFLAAKVLRMRVLEFAFNMGPKVIRLFHDGETEYTIRAIPLGGFVRIAGMEIEDEVESRLTGTQEHSSDLDLPDASGRESDDPNGFNNRPIWQRFMVILAGPIFSFLLGWITLCLMGVVAGIPDKTQLGVREIVKGSVAEQIGIKPGEVLASINGQTIEDYVAALKTIRSSAGKPLTLNVRDKNGKDRTLVATPLPEKDTLTGETIGRLGFAPEPITLTVRRTSLMESFSIGNEKTLLWFELMGKLFSSGPKAIGDNVGGPVAIFKETASASKRGGPDPMFLVGQLSLSLGLFNLLPIPVLDGGHLMLLMVEGIRRRKLTPLWTMRVQYAGLAVLLTIFALVMFKDVSGLFRKG